MAKPTPAKTPSRRRAAPRPATRATAKPRARQGLTHFDRKGDAHMVDVGGKDETQRVAIACGQISMQAQTFRAIAAGSMKKGDVLGVARIAAIQAAKQTPNLIPLAHPIAITRVAVDFELDARNHIVHIQARVECRGRTGVEMEALTAAGAGLLTVYDMCKAIDRGMVISNLMLLEKHGGKSGAYVRAGRSA